MRQFGRDASLRTLGPPEDCRECWVIARKRAVDSVAPPTWAATQGRNSCEFRQRFAALRRTRLQRVVRSTFETTTHRPSRCTIAVGRLI